MKFIILLFLTGCATFQDDPICSQDSASSAICIYFISSKQFHVDNSGSNQFTDHGRNWNFTQLQQNSLLMPPDTWGDLKVSILKYCHDNPDKCIYDSTSETLKIKIKDDQWQTFKRPLSIP